MWSPNSFRPFWCYFLLPKHWSRSSSPTFTPTSNTKHENRENSPTKQSIHTNWHSTNRRTGDNSYDGNCPNFILHSCQERRKLVATIFRPKVIRTFNFYMHRWTWHIWLQLLWYTTVILKLSKLRLKPKYKEK